GCTQGTNPAPVAPVSTQAPGAAPASTTAASSQPSFVMGDHYLETQYKFNSPTDVYSEQFMVDASSWAIKFDVSPKSDTLEKCWFQLDVYDMNSGKVASYTYSGKDAPDKKVQQYAMYKPGSYKIDMKGNLVTVDVLVAKRNPS
ncbi:MAG: hypothetical protein GYA23_01340, partial [Methanomicrobiales archaeon]|nr:hypothetical protein [Methanomicrobiales archaeon]